jgi:hypothetical protein
MTTATKEVCAFHAIMEYLGIDECGNNAITAGRISKYYANVMHLDNDGIIMRGMVRAYEDGYDDGFKNGMEVMR